jgi:hypothetical protein
VPRDTTVIAPEMAGREPIVTLFPIVTDAIETGWVAGKLRIEVEPVIVAVPRMLVDPVMTAVPKVTDAVVKVTVCVAGRFRIDTEPVIVD